ncbi:response regulator transcription factor [Sulfitobacter geojensis]|jgi:two-component system cell cycle response regulator CtrA|uniref:Response regulator transcription factor n=1 Tax=Sulfitobacter geojensis TaxID=1342299 RepID=A0AAE2VXL5_9RHOB|nr:response regulator transcription factor [Sulfitobacter geojensis]MBM1689230.1 response regulator transcription factor [Sulfitobacter geojensis]MBM1693296.1 response regulator transcription factor [Sulfitobacter geojensis]MBM1705462.1 response regulator transcription factor [Sulfitobacter geojensis]MBM1709520.1 response regulator transcription factor [Sulfitobacter geojensis]MBM1713586.1 response regulator transcription factor [Sulfitobacter geojensis]
MKAYVYEQQEERRAGLASELRNAGIDPQFVGSDFFASGLGILTQQGQKNRAILLSECDELREHIRALRMAKCVSPIIVFRNFRNSQDTASLLDLGADDVMVSPIRGAEVVSRMNSVIRRLYGHAADSIVMGELTAYFDGRDPIISGSRIKLSKREHSVFQHLALNSNKVISKDAIYDAVYGSSIDQPFDKIIDVYICKLRKKIAAASESGWQYIETVQGRGYRLMLPETISKAG